MQQRDSDAHDEQMTVFAQSAAEFADRPADKLYRYVRGYALTRV